MYEHLFSPITVNSTEIKTVSHTPHWVFYSYDGKLNERYYSYFQEKARGGAGIVTVGPVGIDKAGSGFIALSLAKDENVEPFPAGLRH